MRRFKHAALFLVAPLMALCVTMLPAPQQSPAGESPLKQNPVVEQVSYRELPIRLVLKQQHAHSVVQVKPKKVKSVVHRHVVIHKIKSTNYRHFGTVYLVTMASCIRHHESGVYTRNSGNGYYGAYQIQDRMWHQQTHLPGHASDYSKAVQDYWFMRIWSKLKTDKIRQEQWVTYKYCSYIRP